jgi:hypothetical protein
MEGPGFNDFSAEQFANTAVHLYGCVDSVGEGENLVGAGMALLNEVLDAVSEDRSLSGARAGDHQHRPMDVLDGLPLAVIRNEWSSTGIRLRRRHRRSEYHLV